MGAQGGLVAHASWLVVKSRNDFALPLCARTSGGHANLPRQIRGLIPRAQRFALHTYLSNLEPGPGITHNVFPALKRVMRNLQNKIAHNNPAFMTAKRVRRTGMG
ncbi:MAG: hypothetical protein LBK13_02190 [Spirochaetales bacterium]|nr:hypothetical protein [Spirochaetales bacterium]